VCNSATVMWRLMTLVHTVLKWWVLIKVNIVAGVVYEIDVTIGTRAGNVEGGRPPRAVRAISTNASVPARPTRTAEFHWHSNKPLPQAAIAASE
jgi:hypothetical protein